MYFTKKTSTPVFLWVFFLVVTLSSCEKKKDEAKRQPPIVAVAKVVKQDLPINLESQAKVVGSLDVRIYAQVGGVIKKRLFKEGEYVEKGTQLFEIEPDIYKANLDKAEGVLLQAESDLKKISKDYKRISALYKKDAVSVRTLDEITSAHEKAVANVKIAKATRDAALVNYNYTKVYAPISGVVRKEVQSVGNLVAPGQAGLLTSMVQIDPLHVEFAIPGEVWSSVITKSLNGSVHLPDNSEYEVEIVLSDGTVYPKLGKIIFIDSSEDLMTGSVSMKAEVKNGKDEKSLMPGQFVKARLLGVKYVGALIIPSKSLIQTEKAAIVYKVESGNIVKPTPVKVIDYVGDSVVINGLKEGDVVVSDGIVKARPGQPITPVSSPIAKKEVK